MACPACNRRQQEPGAQQQEPGAQKNADGVRRSECLVELRRMAKFRAAGAALRDLRSVACWRRFAYILLPAPNRRPLNAKASKADQVTGVDGLSFIEYPLRLPPKRWDC